MRSAGQLALFSVLAAVIGGVAGSASLVLQDADTGVQQSAADSAVLARPPGDGQLGNGQPGIGQHADTSGGSATNTAGGGAGLSLSHLSLTQRIDSPHAADRSELALELLRRGPVALAQARALRPTTTPGQRLQLRLVDALQKMTALRRGGDYARLEEHLRLRLDLDAFATVVPNESLRHERLDYWQHKLKAVRARSARAFATDGEVAFAEVELARVRSELGLIAVSDYRRVARRRLVAIDEWIDALRTTRGVSPARVQALEAQARRLRP